MTFSRTCLYLGVVLCLCIAASNAADSTDAALTLDKIEFPIPAAHELAVAFKILGHELEEGETSPAEFVTWLNQRKQCNATAYLHLHTLRNEPTNYFNQNMFFEALMQCRRFQDMERAARATIGSIISEALRTTSKVSTLTSETFNQLEDLIPEAKFEKLGLAMGNTHDWLATAILLSSGDDRYAEVEENMQLALNLAGTEVDMWPTYCMHWRRLEPGLNELSTGKYESLKALRTHMNTTQQWDVEPRDSMFWKRWAQEILVLGRGAQQDPAQAKLLPLVMELRRIECSWPFIRGQLMEFTAGRKGVYQPSDDEVKLPPVVYTALNHQYGTFFWNGFDTLAKHPQVLRAITSIKNDKEGKMRAFMLGSNIGNEAFYSAIGHGVPTVGVEIICDLVDKAKAMQAKYAPDAPLEFRCDDAGQTDVSNAALVYLDNEVWDPTLNAGLKQKLVAEMPIGGVIIGTSKWDPFEAKTSTPEARRHIVQIGSEVEAGTLTSWGTEFYLFQIKEGALPGHAGSSAGATEDEEDEDDDASAILAHDEL